MDDHSLLEAACGALIDRFVEDADAGALRERAPALPRIEMDAREVADLELIATGAASR